MIKRYFNSISMILNNTVCLVQPHYYHVNHSLKGWQTSIQSVMWRRCLHLQHCRLPHSHLSWQPLLCLTCLCCFIRFLGEWYCIAIVRLPKLNKRSITKTIIVNPLILRYIGRSWLHDAQVSHAFLHWWAPSLDPRCFYSIKSFAGPIMFEIHACRVFYSVVGSQSMLSVEQRSFLGP